MSNFSALLIGDPGAGKTTAASTAPGVVGIIDVDNKLHKMENMQEKLKSGKVIQIPITEPLTSMTLSQLAKAPVGQGKKMIQQIPKGYYQIAEIIDNLAANDCNIEINGKKIHLDTVVLDSYTRVNEHMKRLLMAHNQTTTMTLPLFGTILTNFESLNDELLRLNANVIFIAHQKVTKDDLTGAISYQPLIDGQMSHKIGKDFEEVYFLEKTAVGGKAEFKMLTLGSSTKPCRTSRTLPAKVDPDFSKIYGGLNA